MKTNLEQLEKKTLAHLSYGEQLRPERDWLALVAVFAVLFCASIAVNITIYSQVKGGEVANQNALPASLTSTNAITTAETVFSARAAEESNYEHVYEFVDPSK